MSAPKTQISPVPPELYGERFVKFISGLAKTKEEVEREAEASEQLNNSFDTTNANTNADHLGKSSKGIARRSTDKIIEKAEKQARKSEDRGAIEDERRDRTITAVRSPSAERSNGIGGQVLPIVEEDGEANSREDSLRDGKGPQPGQRAVNVRQDDATRDRPDYTREKTIPRDKAAAILEQATGAAQVQAAKGDASPREAESDVPPPTPEKDSKYQKHQSLPRLPALDPIRMGGSSSPT